MTLLEFAALVKFRYTRGSSWIQFILNFGIITTNIWIFQSWLPKVIPMPLWYFIGFGTYCVVGYIIGHIDEKHGIWNMENQLGVQVSPPTRMMLDQLDRINRQNQLIMKVLHVKDENSGDELYQGP